MIYHESMKKQVKGSCHCGKVQFEANLKDNKVISCNCSICHMKGFMHVIVDKQDFTLLTGEESLQLYQFNTKTAKHYFCQNCGISSFYIPRSHPDGYSLNYRCLNGIDDNDFDFSHFDGKNWEKSVHKLR